MGKGAVATDRLSGFAMVACMTPAGAMEATNQLEVVIIKAGCIQLAINKNSLLDTLFLMFLGVNPKDQGAPGLW